MANYDYFGYGYLDKAEETIPHVPLVFYSFHIMVTLGMYFILLFAIFTFLSSKRNLFSKKIKYCYGLL